MVIRICACPKTISSLESKLLIRPEFLVTPCYLPSGESFLKRMDPIHRLTENLNEENPRFYIISQALIPSGGGPFSISDHINLLRVNPLLGTNTFVPMGDNLYPEEVANQFPFPRTNLVVTHSNQFFGPQLCEGFASLGVQAYTPHGGLEAIWLASKNISFASFVYSSPQELERIIEEILKVENE